MRYGWFCLSVLAAATSGLRAQSFDVATVKATPPGSRAFRLGAQHGTLTGSNITLAQYIAFAYDVLPAQLSGGPAWLAQEPFDITGKAAPDTPDDVVRKMLQNLLAERFDLKLHHTTKEMPVYVLAVAKGGSKLHELKEGEAGFRISRGRVHGEGVTLDSFAAALSGRVGRKVVDETGLAGSYEIDLQWTPEASPASMNPDEASPDPNGPSIFPALQEQLGLRLESRKAPVDLLVIDHVTRTPADN